MKKSFILCLMVVASFFMVFNEGNAAVPNPVVTGPIPAPDNPAPGATVGAPTRNYPFFASQFDLAARGYVEEEFFIEGTANRYKIPVVNQVQQTGSSWVSGIPYKTRIVVRRPASPKKFTGTVLVEWTNVTNGWDMENSWFQIYEYVLRSGHAWVGVSAQRIGVNYLKTWNPTRYGSLNVEYPNIPIPPATLPPTPPSTDNLSYDIFSQAVQAIRNPVGIDPLGGLAPQIVIATGHSQSASQLSTYVNAIQPLAGVIDAFALHGSLGNRIREDSGVPVWKVLSEFDVQSSEARVRRPDGQLFVTWEVTGTSHNDAYSKISRAFLQRRDIGTAIEDSLICTIYMPFGSEIPFQYAFAAGLDHMISWAQGGLPIPSAPLINVLSTTPSIVLDRDSHGNATGGLRLSQLAVPTASNNGTNAGPGACVRWGYSKPFDADVLSSLYRNHGQYVSPVSQVTSDNEQNGYILQADAQQTIVDAAQSSIGKKK